MVAPQVAWERCGLQCVGGRAGGVGSAPGAGAVVGLGKGQAHVGIARGGKMQASRTVLSSSASKRDVRCGVPADVVLNGTGVR